MAEFKNYYRIMLGRGSMHAEACFTGNFIGADFGIDVDLTDKLPEDWKEFNKTFIPIFLEKRPEKSKVAAGLSCGALHTVSKGINKDDYVLCPDGQGDYRVGEVTSGYSYVIPQLSSTDQIVAAISNPLDFVDDPNISQNLTDQILTGMCQLSAC